MIQLIFLDFPREVALNKLTRPKHYNKHKNKVPDHIIDKLGIYYEWGHDGFLYDIETGQRYVRNKADVGNAKTISINGNLVWAIPSSDRETKIKIAQVSLIKRFLVDYFIEGIGKQFPKRIEVNDFPLRIDFDYHIHFGSTNPDEDNLHLFYKKAFYDAIQETYYPSNAEKKRTKIPNPIGFIPEDDLRYIKGGHSLVHEFHGFDNEKLIITIS